MAPRGFSVPFYSVQDCRLSFGFKIYKISASPHHSNKPMSFAGSPSCRPASVRLNLWKNAKRQTDPYGKAIKK